MKCKKEDSPSTNNTRAMVKNPSFQSLSLSKPKFPPNNSIKSNGRSS